MDKIPMRIYVFFLFLAQLLLACGEPKKSSSGGPIVFGDSSTIVTERDTQYLVSYIPEYASLPAIKDTVKANTNPAKKDTLAIAPTPAQPAAQAPQGGKGLTVDFGNAGIFIPNIAVRDPNKATGNSVAYALTQGTLARVTLQATKGKLMQVQQQYTSSIWYDDGTRKAQLKGIALYTSSWETLNNYNTGALDAQGMRFTDANASTLKNALDRALREQKVPSKELRNILSSIGNTAKPNQAPFSVKLNVLKWKLSGSGSDGKDFRYQIRFDIP